MYLGRERKGYRAPHPPFPSHHAILGGSALLHGMFEQHVALRVTETHPARPPQPAGIQGVSKDLLPGPVSPGTTLAQHWAQGYIGESTLRDTGWAREG